LADPESHSTRVVLKAADIIFQSTREHPKHKARPILEFLILIFERVIVRLETSGEGSSEPSLLAMALTLTGYCYEHLDLTDQARRYYDRGLSLFPTNDALLVARGILLYGRETDRSVRDFENAVQRGSPLVWSYFYLAHDALLSDRFDLCLDICTRALRLPASSEVQANLLEWMAISQTSLGYPAEAVESVFQAARRLAQIMRGLRGITEHFEKVSGHRRSGGRKAPSRKYGSSGSAKCVWQPEGCLRHEQRWVPHSEGLREDVRNFKLTKK
jgi:tetratricopeptide (TPR) repeat protein